jgi:hypothetical protein
MANKIRHLRRFLRAWAKNLRGKYKKRRNSLAAIDELDFKAVTVALYVVE